MPMLRYGRRQQNSLTASPLPTYSHQRRSVCIGCRWMLPLDVLFHNLHRNCIQRKIQRAEREGLNYQSGQSEILLREFYDLLLRTRRRHCLPPQPLQWFRNLVESMGDNLTIRLVSKDRVPVAAILTLSHKGTITYKYGCSDERFHNLGGTPFLLWKTIEEAKNQGMREFDLGRSDLDHAGLIQFKDRMGAVKTMLSYWRYPGARAAECRAPPLARIKLRKRYFPGLRILFLLQAVDSCTDI